MNRASHIAELRGYGILDTANEPVFDQLVRTAARAFNAPIALISLIDEDRQWFKARHGLLPQETPRTISFCTHAIQGADVFVVPDATQDRRFVSNPLVTGEPNIRFYAGAPLRTPTGQRIGTLCIIDTRPREDFPEAARLSLQRLAGEVMQAVEQRNSGGAARTGERQTRVKRESRSPTWLEAAVIRQGGHRVPVVITNISTRGCRIKSGETLNPGEQVHIEVPRLGQVSAQVRWAKGSDAGAEFVQGSDRWEKGAAADGSAVSWRVSRP